MLPRRFLPSWLGRQLHAIGGGDLAGVGLAVALLVPLVRVLPGHAVVPGKDLAGGLVGFPGKNPAEGCYLPILI